MSIVKKKIMYRQTGVKNHTETYILTRAQITKLFASNLGRYTDKADLRSLFEPPGRYKCSPQ